MIAQRAPWPQATPGSPQPVGTCRPSFMYPALSRRTRKRSRPRLAASRPHRRHGRRSRRLPPRATSARLARGPRWLVSRNRGRRVPGFPYEAPAAESGLRRLPPRDRAMGPPARWARDPRHRAPRPGFSCESAGAESRLRRLLPRAHAIGTPRLAAFKCGVAAGKCPRPRAPNRNRVCRRARCTLVSRNMGDAAGLLVRVRWRGFSIPASSSA